jgi:hypothetical protein
MPHAQQWQYAQDTFTVMTSSSTYSIFDGAKGRLSVAAAFVLAAFVPYVGDFVFEFFWYASFTVDRRLPFIAKNGVFAASLTLAA